jgi:hypothetical protein
MSNDQELVTLLRALVAQQPAAAQQAPHVLDPARPASPAPATPDPIAALTAQVSSLAGTVEKLANTRPSNPYPVSDKGAPAAGTAFAMASLAWRQELASHPHNMSAASLAAMNAELGHEKARRTRLERVAEMGHTVAVNVGIPRDR